MRPTSSSGRSSRLFSYLVVCWQKFRRPWFSMRYARSSCHSGFAVTLGEIDLNIDAAANGHQHTAQSILDRILTRHIRGVATGFCLRTMCHDMQRPVGRDPVGSVGATIPNNARPDDLANWRGSKLDMPYNFTVHPEHGWIAGCDKSARGWIRALTRSTSCSARILAVVSTFKLCRIGTARRARMG